MKYTLSIFILFLMTMRVYSQVGLSDSLFMKNTFEFMDSVCSSNARNREIVICNEDCVKAMEWLTEDVDMAIFREVVNLVNLHDGRFVINQPTLSFFKLWYYGNHKNLKECIFDRESILVPKTGFINAQTFGFEDTLSAKQLILDTDYTDWMFASMTEDMDMYIKTHKPYYYHKSFYPLCQFAYVPMYCCSKVASDSLFQEEPDIIYDYNDCILKKCFVDEYDKVTNYMFECHYGIVFRYDFACVSFIRLWYLMHRELVPQILCNAIINEVFNNAQLFDYYNRTLDSKEKHK